jgi:uncharacterized protein (TIGR00255 family)
MPQSMTGFGRAESRGRGPRLLCEARSVNHRFLTTKIRLPAQLQRLESWVDARVQSRFQRGSIEIAIFWRGAGETLAARLDEKVADRYLAALRAYLKKRKLAPDVDPATLIGLPGVMAAPDPDEIARDFKPALQAVVDDALGQLAAMRAREGERLEKALRREAKTIADHAARLAIRIPDTVAMFQKRLDERLRTLLQHQSVAPDPALLAREVAIFADKSDVTEELDRLKSHETEFGRLLARSGPIGRELEFLVQEIGREVQTVGSKVQDVTMLADVRAAKAALEKLREQVQNSE